MQCTHDGVRMSKGKKEGVPEKKQAVQQPLFTGIGRIVMLVDQLGQDRMLVALLEKAGYQVEKVEQSFPFSLG